MLEKSAPAFAFGENWARFLTSLSDAQIEEATRAVSTLVGRDLRDTTFLDIGSGSGLSSLAARRLGARVRSFDYDAQSVACTQELRQRFFPGDDAWTVAQGSVLDQPFLATLGQFDIVYSWGVLHHTGQMWHAIENAARLVRPGGLFIIGIYNFRGGRRGTAAWARLKRWYCTAPRYVVASRCDRLAGWLSVRSRHARRDPGIREAEIQLRTDKTKHQPASGRQ